jgi:hypothetical protein
MAENDSDLRDQLMTACEKSVLFFINAFVFTVNVFEAKEDGSIGPATYPDAPFLTYPVQDRMLLRMNKALEEGHGLLTDKSRNMGATWVHIAWYAHRFLFRKNEKHLVLSRKQDAVDMLDSLPKGYPYGPIADPGTLFGKFDYILSKLPSWMIGKVNRKKMHVVNQTTGTRVDGESANATAGSADRRTTIFLDEMAKMAEGESIKRSTKDVSATRFACSTPNGAGTAFSKWRLSGQIPVFVLPWWEHPDYSIGLYCVKDNLDRWQIRSPWYDRECEERTEKEVAIELDMDHVGSGDLFFSSMDIEMHKKKFGMEPKRRLDIMFKPSIPEERIPQVINARHVLDVLVRPGRKAKWQIWTNLIDGRPDQSHTYTVGVDISKGMGASNSTISVMCNETGQKIMAFADANTPPYELAKIACAVCIWVGGRGRALLIWENNGDPGFDFGRQITKVYEYPNVYYAKQAGTISEKKGKRYGWRSSPEEKATALGMLARAYAHSGFINHDIAALDECLQYVYYDGGGIGPGELVEESASARKTHGDRVIADMLCVVGSGRIRHKGDKKDTPPPNSIGGRMKKWKHRKRSKANKNRFDFR